MRYALAALVLAACTRPPGGMGETGDPLEDCGTLDGYDACVLQSDGGGVCKVGIWSQRCGVEYMDELEACEAETACTASARDFLDTCQPDAQGNCDEMAGCLADWWTLVDACFSE